jgi:hypothetical protein
MEVYLYDEGGDLVALIKQTELVAVLTEGTLKDNPKIAGKFKIRNTVMEFNFILQEHYAQNQSLVPLPYLPLLSAKSTNLTISNV